jgi:hypothetical protein
LLAASSEFHQPREELDMANDILAGIVSSVIHHVVAPLIRPTSQHIFNLRVAPGIDFVRISFQTVQPTIPVITCEASDGSMTFAFPIFGGMRTKHESILGENTPLQQDVNHLLRIVAAGRDSQGHQIEKIATGNFTTGSRHATIKFDSIKVRNDSDSGGNGELTLFFTGGDADNGVLMGGPLVWPYMDINDDDPPAVLNLEFQIQKAPRRLWAAVSAYDSDFAPFPNVDDVNKIGPVFSFNGEGSEGWSSDAYDYANVTRVVDIADMIKLTEFPIELATRDFALAYTVNGRIRVDPFVPAAIESRPPGPGFDVKPPIDLSVIGTAQLAPKPGGGGGSGGDEGGYGHFVGLGANGAIYHKRFTPGEPATDREWVRVPGEAETPVKALTGRDGRLNLFAFDGKGGVLYQKPGASGGETSWKKLGGRLFGPLAVAEGPTGEIEVFGLGENGLVYHTSIRPDGRRNRDGWQRIGERVGGSLSAFAFPDGTVGVFALGQDGRVLHKQRRRNQWKPRGLEWHSLGKAAGKRLIVGRPAEEKGIGIATLADDDSLRYLAWPDYPDGEPPHRWKDVGTIDNWLDSQPPRARGADRRAAAAKRNRPARGARSASPHAPPRTQSRAKPEGGKPR